jgi:glutathione S-transferase
MDYYKKYLSELESHGYHVDILNMKDKSEFEEDFKKIFPSKVVDLIINNNSSLAPLLINSDSILLSLTAKFCLSNPRK